MFRHWHAIAKYFDATKSDVVMPRRSDASFQRTYPIEQYHSEMFGNMYLNSLGSKIGLPNDIDWTMGPVAFRCHQAHHWIDYDGAMWDAQLVPLVRAHNAGAKVSSAEIDYEHPATMKEQEQGEPIWNEKRLMQLNFLQDTVAKALKESSTTSVKN